MAISDLTPDAHEDQNAGRFQCPPPPTDIDPADLPDLYAMIIDGNCLEPMVAHGSWCAFDKRAAPERGGLVVLWKRPELVRPGESQAMVKRLVTVPPPWVTFPHRKHPNSTVDALVIVEQLNPAQQFAVRCETLVAIHKLVDVRPLDADGSVLQ